MLPDFDLGLALCGQSDPEAFFPEKHSDEENTRAINSAKQVCSACPVKMDCLNWALTNEEKYGIWGGLTATERRRLTARIKDAKVKGRYRDNYERKANAR